MTVACLLLAAVSVRAELMLNGAAPHLVSGSVRFVAGLYLETRSDNAMSILRADEAKRMQLVIRAPALEGRAFRKMWMDSLAANAGQEDLRKYAESLAKFTNMLGADLRRDDEVVIDRSPRGVDVSLNGMNVGHLADPRFFDFLLRSWIGPVPLSQTLRQALLGGAKADAQLVAILTDAEKRNSAGATTDETADTLVAEQPSDQPAAPKNTMSITPGPVELDTTAIGKPETMPVAIDDSLLALNQPARSVDQAPRETVPAAAEFAPAAESDDTEITAERILSEQLYVVELRKIVQRNLEYPQTALSRGWEGSVRVQVTVARDGKLQTIDVEEEAKYSILTEAVTKAIKRAAPFPEIPSAIDDSALTFSMPVNFSLNDATK